MKTRHLNRAATAAALVASIMFAASAQAATATDQRHNAVTLYGWFPSLSGDLNYDVGGGDSATVDAGDILSALNMVFMGAFETRKNKWSLLADVIYLNLGDKKTSSVDLPFGGSLNTRVDLKLKGWQVGLYGGYNLYDTPKASLDALAGLRYPNIDTEAKLSIDGPLPPSLPTAKLSKSADVWDAVVGFRGRAHINDRWFVPYYADVGAGDSDLTWQAMAGIGYEASWGETSLVYRHLEWDQGDDGLLKKLSFSGPAVAFKFRF